MMLSLLNFKNRNDAIIPLWRHYFSCLIMKTLFLIINNKYYNNKNSYLWYFEPHLLIIYIHPVFLKITQRLGDNCI